MRRRAYALIQSVLLLVVVGVLAAIAIVIIPTGKENPSRSTCQSNLKQIGLGLLQYQQDYDEINPPVSSGSEGWADNVQPYLRSREVFICPSGGTIADPPTIDYFYNAHLSMLPVSKVRGYKRAVIQGNVYTSRTGWSNTIMAGDGATNAGTNSHLTELTFEWRSDENSPARRHLDGANYLFTDGHVKWYKPERVGTAPPRKEAREVTFAIR